MRVLTVASFALFTIGWLASAAEPGTTLPPEALPVSGTPVAEPTEIAKRTTPKPAEQLEYTRLFRRELELNAQLKLLAELIEEQLSRSDPSAETWSPERARWEAELVRDLRSRNSAMLEQLNGLARQRLAFEMAHTPAPAPGLDTWADGKPLNLDESAYVTRLDERLLKVREQLLALDDLSRELSSELSTNSSSEAVGRISALLDVNNWRAARWEQEQSDLELKKLEFRALRK